MTAVAPSPWATGSNTLEPVVIPEPEIRARPALPEDFGTPRSGMRQLLSLAKKLGLTTRATYARGPYVGARGEVLRIVDDVLIRVYDADRRQLAAAKWCDEKFECGFIRPNPNSTDIQRVGANDLKNYLKESVS